MPKLIGRVLVVLALCWCGSAGAVPITDTVVVDDTEWAQVSLFTDLSWNDLNTVCPGGVCIDGGTLNGYDVTGWAWASIDKVNALLNAYLSDAGVEAGDLLTGIDTYSEPGSAWAPAFLDDFDGTCGLGCDDSAIVFGAMYQPNAGQTTIYKVAENGVVSPDQAGNHGILWGNDDASSAIGAWFYRADIPTPASIPLLGIALAALGFSRIHR